MDNTTIGSAVAGSTACAFIVRYFLIKALADLSKVSEQVSQIINKLCVIEVKLEQLEKLEKKTEAHDTEIMAIKSRLKYERSTGT